ncbi:MAG: hypothetical protein K0S47_2465 [Herbinix sp.]|nr:hypothetical protein [Herbinix sp.]
MYIAALNVLDSSDEIEVENLTTSATGCLHDYTITTEDMKKLADADVFIINGGDMESFLSDIVKNYPDLYVINASEGISLLSEREETAENTSGLGDTEDEANAHVWLNPLLYQAQIENIKNGILEYLKQEDKDESNLVTLINNNTETYLSKVKSIDIRLDEELQGIKKEGVVIFHDAFAYLADRIGLPVYHTVEIESDTALNASEIADIIKLVQDGKVKLLFTELQYSDTIANRIEEETDAKVYIIDSGVTGDGSKDSYLKAMEHNLSVLKDALK